MDASWWPPEKIPVIDPATDFPPQANAEDPWLIEFEQVMPIKVDNIDEDVLKVTIHHRGTDPSWIVRIYVWNLEDSAGYDHRFPRLVFMADNPIDDQTSVGHFTLTKDWWSAHGGYEGYIIPGHHFGVLMVGNSKDGDEKREMLDIYSAQFVDIYIET